MNENVGVVGGGGCLGSLEVMLPDLPFDYLQPPMVHGITQVGYGGPFVIRGNPVGAVLDTIRGFCAPMPMEIASPDGTYLPMGSMDGFTDLSGLGQSAGFAGGAYSGFPAVMCPADMPLLNQQTGMCSASPTPSTAPASTGGGPVISSFCSNQMNFDMVMTAGDAALASYDDCGICKALVQAGACNNPSAGLLQSSWAMVHDAWRRDVDAIWGTSAICYSPVGKLCPSGKSASGGTSNPQSFPAAMANTSMTGIGSILPGIGRPSNLVPTLPSTRGNVGGMGVGGAMNPNTGGNPGPLETLTSYRLPPMPRMPQMTDLTEGNVSLTPSPEPMGGGFAPEASIPGRVMRTPMQILRGFFSRGRRG